MYFAGQSSFALYMKLLGVSLRSLLEDYPRSLLGSIRSSPVALRLVLSEETISHELHLRGMPAAFLVTAIQQLEANGRVLTQQRQVVAFISLGLLTLGLKLEGVTLEAVRMLILCFSPHPYMPRYLGSAVGGVRDNPSHRFAGLTKGGRRARAS